MSELINLSHWGAGQWLILAWLGLAALGGYASVGKPATKLVRVSDNVEVKDHTSLTLSLVLHLALLTWGGFFG